MENEQFYLDKFRTEADYLLFDVPRENRTYAVCLEAVKRDWHNFSLVPYDLRTAEICMEALKHNGIKYGMLPYIPKEIQDPQVWLLAVKNGLHIKRVPPELLTEEMCICAAKYISPQENAYGEKTGYSNSRYTRLYSNYTISQREQRFYSERDPQEIPEHFRTKAFWLAVIKVNVNFIKVIPDHFKTDDFYWEAVRSNGAILEYVPAKLKTPAFCLAAVKSSNKALPWIPKKQRTEALYITAVQCHGTALEYVPKKKKTESLCMEAVRSDGWALLFVPEKLRTMEICLAAYKECPGAKKYIPKTIVRKVISTAKERR